MKKLFILLSVAALLLCGCGNAESPAGVVTPATDAVTEAATEAAPPEKALSFGRIEGGVYTNTYAGMGCTMDENWSIYSAEELQALPETVQGAIEGSQLEEVMSEYAQIFDLQAENVNDLLAVNVVYTKVGMQERLLYATQTEEETVDSVLSQADLIKESYTQAGMAVESMEKVQVTFLGESHYGIRTVANSQGVPIYMVQLMNFDLGAYGINLTATSYLEDNTQAILDLFYPVA